MAKRNLFILFVFLVFLNAFSKDIIKEKMQQCHFYFDSVIQISGVIRKGRFHYKKVKTPDLIKKGVNAYILEFDKADAFGRVPSILFLEYKGEFFPPSAAIENDVFMNDFFQTFVDWGKINYSDRQIRQLADLCLSRSYWLNICDNRKDTAMERIIKNNGTILYLRYVYMLGMHNQGACAFKSLFVMHIVKDIGVTQVKLIKLEL